MDIGAMAQSHMSALLLVDLVDELSQADKVVVPKFDVTLDSDGNASSPGKEVCLGDDEPVRSWVVLTAI
ncbi:MAG: hypothetical protein ACKPKO_46095, partial [Candidatus Fonsibacter sp.]